MVNYKVVLLIYALFAIFVGVSFYAFFQSDYYHNPSISKEQNSKAYFNGLYPSPKSGEYLTEPIPLPNANQPLATPLGDNFIKNKSLSLF